MNSIEADVKKLKNSQSVIILKFDSPLPLSLGDRIVILNENNRSSIKSRRGFQWWHIGNGGADVNWYLAAREYARCHGSAFVLHEGRVGAIFSRHGLTFRRDHGRIIWPPLDDGEIHGLFEIVKRLNVVRFEHATKLAGQIGARRSPQVAARARHIRWRYRGGSANGIIAISNE